MKKNLDESPLLRKRPSLERSSAFKRGPDAIVNGSPYEKAAALIDLVCSYHFTSPSFTCFLCCHVCFRILHNTTDGWREVSS